MLIKKLKLNYFGHFHNREIELKPGINLIYGDNEAGKSTIHAFIKGMLFGIERMRGRGSASKEDSYTRYLPWGYPGAYEGSMDIVLGEKEYRLQRSFHANNKNFTVLDLSTGREIKLKEGLISEIIPDLTESVYKNTISIEQLKVSTDLELTSQVRNYITNLSITKSKEIDVTKAFNILNNKRKQLDLTKCQEEIKALQLDIEEGMQKEKRMDELSLQRRDLLHKEQQLKAELDKLTATEKKELERMELFPAIFEKYDNYETYRRQAEALELQEQELNNKIFQWEKELPRIEIFIDACKVAEKLYRFQQDLEKQQREFKGEKTTTLETKQRNSNLILCFSILAAMIVLLVSGMEMIGVGIAIGVLSLGGFIFWTSNHSGGKALAQQKLKEKDLNAKLTDATKKINEICKEHQAKSVEELLKKQEEIKKNQYAMEHSEDQKKNLEQQRSMLEDRCDLLYETIMKYMQNFIQAEELTSEAIRMLREEINHRRSLLQGKVSDINQKLEAYKLQREKITWEVNALEANEEQLLINKDRLSSLEQSMKEGALEQEAVKLALTTIQELSTDIHDSFGEQLNQSVSDIIQEVTNGRYNDLKIDEKLEVKVGWNGNYHMLDRLSAGTMDQVYFALRLAVADLLLENRSMPLLFDDSFALYDEMRVRASLNKISDREQVVLFTCHKREKELLEEQNIPYHFIDLSY
ncbi:MAG: AAA family ATPase [Mobilitalea sp.]